MALRAFDHPTLAVRRCAVRMRSRSRGRDGSLYVRFTGTA